MYSSQTAQSDGTLARLDLSLSYISKDDIYVFVDDVLLPTPDYSWAWVGNDVIQFNQAIETGSIVNVRRITPLERMRHVFSVGGAIFKDKSVDENFRQLLFQVQEFSEGSVLSDLWNDLNMHGFRVRNLGKATDSRDAVSLGQYQADATGAWQAYLQATQVTAAAQIKLDSIIDYSAAMTTVLRSDDTGLSVLFPDGSLVPTVAKRCVDLTSAVSSVNGMIGNVVLDLRPRKDVTVYNLSAEGFVEGDVDNTPALVTLMNKVTGHTIINVDGLYQFTVGNVVKDMGGKNITIVGSGASITGLTYKRTLGNKTAYVDDDDANKILTIKNAADIHLTSLGLRGLTSLDNPNGATTNKDAVYFGDVWGLVLDSFDTCTLQDCVVTGFNYRGISVKCSDTVRKQNGTVRSINSNYLRNKGSGLWVRYTREVYVDGGESAYNGQRGQYGTGYGVTASLAVNYLSCVNHYFHHNYRKGLDTHGCLNVDIHHNRFVDNVCYHLALLQWGTVEGGSLFNTAEYINITNNSFSKGHDVASRAWLDDAYAANTANGFAPSMNDINIDAVLGDGVTFGSSLRRVRFADNLVESVYYGTTVNNPNCASQFVFRVASINTDVVTVANNIFDVNRYVTLRNSMYNASFMFTTVKRFELTGNTLSGANANLTYGAYSGTVVLTQDEQTLQFVLKGNSFKLPKCYLLSAYSGAGAAFPAVHKVGQNGQFITDSCDINFKELPTKELQAYAYLGRIFDNTYPQHISFNNRISIGSVQYAPLPVKREPQQFTTAFKAPYGVGVVAADTEVMYIDLDPTLAFHLGVNFKPFNEVVSIWKMAGVFPTGLSVTPSTNYTYSRGLVVTLPNGQEVNRIYIKTRTALTLATSMFGTLDIVSFTGSYGIVDVRWLG